VVEHLTFNHLFAASEIPDFTSKKLDLAIDDGEIDGTSCNDQCTPLRFTQYARAKRASSTSRNTPPPHEEHLTNLQATHSGVRPAMTAHGVFWIQVRPYLSDALAREELVTVSN
jgi:hypothetical protein